MIEIKFLARTFLYLNFTLQPLFQSAQHFYENRNGSGAVLMTNESGCGSGRPKNIWILRIQIRKIAFNFSFRIEDPAPSSAKNQAITMYTFVQSSSVVMIFRIWIPTFRTVSDPDPNPDPVLDPAWKCVNQSPPQERWVANWNFFVKLRKGPFLTPN
jgi:hypothetical protein